MIHVARLQYFPGHGPVYPPGYAEKLAAYQRDRLFEERNAILDQKVARLLGATRDQALAMFGLDEPWYGRYSDY